MNSTSSIITIGREYGSGGRQIGQEVAKYFGIKCYDKELLEHAANESGICKELFENHDEILNEIGREQVYHDIAVYMRKKGF